MKMKAAVIYEDNSPFVIEEVELDPPKAGEVLVKLKASGVCKSDIRAIMGHYQRPWPAVLGHEGAGIVEEVGEGVTGFAPGDSVILTFLPNCGKCRWCHTGHPNKCDLGAQLATGKYLDGTVRHHLARDGSDLNCFLFVSTFGEYTIAPVNSLVKVPSHLPLEQLCLLGCGFSTGFGAASVAAHIRPGETVTIVGCGGLGLSATQGAALQTPGKLICVDLHPEKLAMAKKFGATHTVQMKGNVDEVVEEIMEITHGVGTDFAFEIAGLVGQDTSIQIAFRALRKGGHLFFVGSGEPDMRSLPIDPFTLQQWQKSITGVLFGDTQFKADIPRFVELFEQGKINLKDMVSLELPLEQINTAVDNIAAKNRVARQVIRYF